MCGIAGYLDSTGGTDPDEMRSIVRRMTTRIAHRGPDDEGQWLDSEAGLALGHRRLSIIDLSSSGHQPMVSQDGRWVIAFNGEIYNFRAIRRGLEDSGHTFHGTSDTEVMLAAIARWGVLAAVRMFNGMFAFALWDRKERQLHLARDRFGEKPLYYGFMGGVLLFSSELKAMRAHPAFAGELDRDALTLYLRHGYFPAPRSVYRGISKLEPGTLVRFDLGGPSRVPVFTRYWSLHEQVVLGAGHPFRGDEGDAVDELDALLRDAVLIRMESDVPLGAFLSGGVDSSMVVALMQAQRSTPVKTFTIGFHESGFDEARYSKAVAAYLGTDHSELYLKPSEALDVIPSLPEMYDEPFGDSSQIATHLVSRLARRSVTVALSGDAGDELFAGYVGYRYSLRLWSAERLLPLSVRRLLGDAMMAVPDRMVDAAVHAASMAGRSPRGGRAKFASKLERLASVLAAQDLEAVHASVVSHHVNPASFVLGASEPQTVLSDPARWADVTDGIARMTYLDAMMYLPDDILVKVDRASMAVGLEARVPLLDHRLAEFAWSLPPNLKLRGGRGKWVLRRLLDRYVPSELVDRGKKGFALPIGLWLQGPLREWASELLSPDAIARDGILDPRAVEAMLHEHRSHRVDRTSLIWSLLMLQAWLRHEER
ncbi:MAG: asparagine synthase (glutamine-hydrolyzing) [Chloroflexota bacterium]